MRTFKIRKYGILPPISNGLSNFWGSNLLESLYAVVLVQTDDDSSPIQNDVLYF